MSSVTRTSLTDAWANPRAAEIAQSDVADFQPLQAQRKPPDSVPIVPRFVAPNYFQNNAANFSGNSATYKEPSSFIGEINSMIANSEEYLLRNLSGQYRRSQDKLQDMLQNLPGQSETNKWMPIASFVLLVLLFLIVIVLFVWMVKKSRGLEELRKALISLAP